MSDTLRDRLAASLSPSLVVAPDEEDGPTFRAHDEAGSRDVLVTVLPEVLTGQVSGERYRLELTAAAGVVHANVVPVLGGGEVAGRPYYLTAAVEGETLRARLRRERVPVAEAIGILRDIAKGLGAAHARGIVHRALSPAQVLLAGGTARVSGVGVARALLAAAATRRRPGVPGPDVALVPAAHAAPEQLAADPLLDHRVDLYAWGVIAWELLSGESPEAALTAAGPGGRRTLPPLGPRAPGAPRALVALVERALRPAPAERPRSATEIVSALDHVRADDIVPTRAGARAPSIVPWRRLAGVAAVLGALVLGIRFVQRDQGRRAPSLVAVAPFRVAGLSPELQWLREGMPDLLAPVLDQGGSRMVAPRALLAAITRGGAGAGAWTGPGPDVDTDALVRAARAVDAGLLLDGTVTGTRDRLEVRGTLLDIRNGGEVAKLTAEGPVDSLAVLVSRVAAGVLGIRPARAWELVARRLSPEPGALREYAAGRMASRAGRTAEALRAFDAAAAQDPGFALAWLRGARAAEGLGSADASARWRRAWDARDRLSSTDSLAVAAWLGPASPVPGTGADRVRAAEELAERLPEDAEAHEAAGTLLARHGGLAGIAEWRSRAAERLERAVALDSGLASAWARLAVLHAEGGARERAVAALQALARLDTTASTLAAVRLPVVLGLGDADRLAAAVAQVLRRPPEEQGRVAVGLIRGFPGVRPEVAERLAAAAWAAVPEGPGRDVVANASLEQALNAGQAWRLWEVVRGYRDTTVRHAAALVTVAVAGIEPEPAAAAAQALERALPAALAAADPGVRAIGVSVADAPWALLAWLRSRGDTAGLARLARAAEASSAAASSAAASSAAASSAAAPSGRRREPVTVRRATALAALARAELAVLRGEPVAPRLARADSALLAIGDASGFGPAFGTWALARAWDRAGDAPRALATVRRLAPPHAGALTLAATRDLARWAERAGDRRAALEAWRAAAAMQARAGRAERAGFEEAAREVARLAAGPR